MLQTKSPSRCGTLALCVDSVGVRGQAFPPPLCSGQHAQGDCCPGKPAAGRALRQVDHGHSIEP